MDTDTYNAAWDDSLPEPVPYERLLPGVRYRVVIADC